MSISARISLCIKSKRMSKRTRRSTSRSISVSESTTKSISIRISTSTRISIIISLCIRIGTFFGLQYTYTILKVKNCTNKYTYSLNHIDY